MNRTARKILIAGLLTLTCVGAASAFTSHIRYPNQTPYGAPLGTVEVRNRGDLLVDLYIDGTIIGRLAPGDRMIIHDVWAGETSIRWEYTWNYDGQTSVFDLYDRQHFVCDIFPSDPRRCGYQPVYGYPYPTPTYDQPVYQPPVYQPTVQPVHNPQYEDLTLRWDEGDFGLSFNFN